LDAELVRDAEQRFVESRRLHQPQDTLYSAWRTPILGR
jgi:hypothetical protein